MLEMKRYNSNNKWREVVFLSSNCDIHTHECTKRKKNKGEYCLDPLEILKSIDSYIYILTCMLSTK